MRYLGVDNGKKRVGLAISDPGESFSMPLKVLARHSQEQVITEIAALCVREEIGGLVVGLPLNMDGTKGQMAQEAEKLAESLAARTGLPVEMWDERLSSVAAERLMINADLSRAKRRQKIDKVAAQIILHGFLESRRGQK